MSKGFQIRKNRKLFLLAFSLLFCVQTVRAQEGTATLKGTVLDPNGAIVPAATVSVANQETGINRRTATTNESGDYVFPSLTPGLYRVTVEAANFKTSVKENVRLNVGETQEFNFTECINAGFAFEVFNLANRANYDETLISGRRVAKHLFDTLSCQASTHFAARFPCCILISMPVNSI